MAEFKLNDGNPVQLKIDPNYDQTKIYISVDVIPENDIIKVGGMSNVNCINFEILDLIFKDYSLDYSFKLYTKILNVEVHATKFKVKESDLTPDKIPVTCKLNIEAGDNFIKEYTLDDTSDLTINSVFIYKIEFLK